MLSSSSVIADIVAPVVQKEQPGKAPDPAMTHSATLRLLQYRTYHRAPEKLDPAV